MYLYIYMDTWRHPGWRTVEAVPEWTDGKCDSF